MHEEIERMFSLRGKTALVTGGSSPLGLDAASVLAAAGCDIVITSREESKAESAALWLSGRYSIKTWHLKLDHTRVQSIIMARDRLLKMDIVPDILVNNAGGGSGRSISDLFDRSYDDISASIETNLTGVLYSCKAIAELMKSREAGKIINIASIAGLVGRDRRIYADTGMLGQPVDYAAAKAGVIGLTRDLAAYLAPMGILVNSISPGGFTGPDRKHPDSFEERYNDRTPLRRMGADGSDLKGAILFLASRASDYVTGQNIVVDGGFTMYK